MNHRIVVLSPTTPDTEREAVLAEVGEPTVTVTLTGDPALCKTLAFMWANSTRKNLFAVEGKLKDEARILVEVRS